MRVTTLPNTKERADELYAMGQITLSERLHMHYGKERADELYAMGQITLSERLHMHYCIAHRIDDTNMPIAPSYYTGWLENKLWALECELETLKERQ